jgi:hypothetical protein
MDVGALFVAHLQAAGSFIPEQNPAVEVLRDDGILGRRFEDVGDEVDGFLWVAWKDS